MSNNWPREYERVTDLKDVDREDMVAFTKAKHQWVRDRAIDLETVKILRERVKNCQRKEGVNHPQRCRDHAIAYMTALRKYQSEGWKKIHSDH
ncbi:NADH dehydrogenase [ubiquinone] 1 beta subcomplex subunit 10-like [Halichondria panicea]|uniref:NADH dehydrogenase [ubiquinone] 1 beta subcomplex subunit 10-like n=1 Tax=Halichondria panicea TaxID=6063 RepID=UPI00312BC24F